MDGKTFRRYFCSATMIFSLAAVRTTGLDIRLWPVNERGNEGFVEVFYNGTWGFLGNPQDSFNEATSNLLCRTLGISKFGYSTGWTSIDNYMGYSWLHGLVCSGNETDIDQCYKPYKWDHYNYGNKTDWSYRHGTRLYCTDSRLVAGEYHNSGKVETVIQDKVYAICHDGFDINAANVLCNSLGYDGAVEVFEGEAVESTIFRGTLNCKGCEKSLSNCVSTVTKSSACTSAAYVTCRAVRMSRINRYVDEGPVEIFYNGSWGLIGDPGFRFDDTTARYLCSSFGFGDLGFSTSAHSLSTYGRKGWVHSLSCKGTETNVMQCTRPNFSFTPYLVQTFRRGTWLYCFDYNITAVRLMGGAEPSEGIVQLQINGRWGSICTYAMRNFYMEPAARVLCRQMGFNGTGTVVYENNRGNREDLVWMSEMICSGSENSISECRFTKGPLPPCYDSPTLLRVKCTDNEGGTGTIVG